MATRPTRQHSKEHIGDNCAVSSSMDAVDASAVARSPYETRSGRHCSGGDKAATASAALAVGAADGKTDTFFRTPRKQSSPKRRHVASEPKRGRFGRGGARGWAGGRGGGGGADGRGSDGKPPRRSRHDTSDAGDGGGSSAADYRSRSRISERGNAAERSNGAGRLSLPTSRIRHHNYDPLIELRQVSDRLNMYQDWGCQMDLFDSIDSEKRSYKEKLRTKARLSGKLDMSGEPVVDMEEDEEVLVRRQRDLDRTKTAAVYGEYVRHVPKPLREAAHPRTPNKFQKVSRRAWDGAVKHWKQILHDWASVPFKRPARSNRSSRDTSLRDVSLLSTGSGDAMAAPLPDEDTLTDLPMVRRASSPAGGPEPDVLHSGLTSELQSLGATSPRGNTPRKRRIVNMLADTRPGDAENAALLGSPSKRTRSASGEKPAPGSPPYGARRRLGVVASNTLAQPPAS